MNGLLVATRDYLDTLISIRPGEIKLGEAVQCCAKGNWENDLLNSDAKFVLLGIPEDIGVRANHGVGGTHTIWEPALKALLNIQQTEQLPGNNLLVLGAIDVVDLMARSEGKSIDDLREMVALLDELVASVIQKIAACGKVPIVVGGGHNNAYPILHGFSLAKGVSVNCINLDAHSDYRKMEGRHSGNGFRYAKANGSLDKYAVIGLHKNYNAQDIIDGFRRDESLHYSFYEDIFIHNKLSFIQSIRDAIVHTDGKPTGIELDLDGIENTLSSAMTPCGIMSLQARQYIATCAAFCDVAYLHIAEGAVALRDGRTDGSAAKLVAYLISDFLRKGDKGQA